MTTHDQGGTESNTLIGTGVAWAKLVLLKIGFDATAEDANAWLPPMRSETGRDDITDADLDTARRELETESKGKRFLRKREILTTQVEILFLTPAGQDAIREAIRDRKLPSAVMAKILE
jgi:hypothetical protein